MNRNAPPAFACKLLEYALPSLCQEAMFGDLIEEYALRAESTSVFTASRWFWGQVGRSLPSMIWSSLRCGDWFISVSIALGVYLAMGMLKFTADLMISRLIGLEKTTHVMLTPIVFLAITATGGYVAARIHRSSTIFLALIVTITVVVLINLKLCAIPVPWWYQFGFLTLGPLAVLMTPALVCSLKSGAQGPST